MPFAKDNNVVEPLAEPMAEPMADPLAAQGQEATVGEMYSMMGWTRYHTTLFIICGLGWVADAIETGLLSYLKGQVSLTWPELEHETVYLTSLQYMVFIGEFIGCFIWGPLADRYGRKFAFLISNLGLCSFGILSAAMPTFWGLVVMRFLVGICIGGIIIPFDMLIECCEAKKAAQVSFGVQYFWTSGTIYVNLMAKFLLPMKNLPIEPWRFLTIAAALPIVLAALGYFVMEESPLWLQDVGRDEEALAVLNRIAKSKKASKDVLNGYTLVPYKREEEPSFSEVLKVPYRRRTIVFASIWLLGLFGYYGASLADPVIFPPVDGAVDFTSVLFSSCGEVFGVMAFSLVVLYLSPLKAMIVFFIWASVAIGCIFLRYIPSFPTFVLTIIVFLARAGVMGASAGYYLITPQSYPTHIRCTAHSFVNLFGRAGGFFATIAGSLSGKVGFGIQLGLYCVANAICAVITAIEGPKIQYDDEALEVLAEDLSGSHISKQRTRSFLSQDGDVGRKRSSRGSDASEMQAR